MTGHPVQKYFILLGSGLLWTWTLTLAQSVKAFGLPAPLINYPPPLYVEGRHIIVVITQAKKSLLTLPFVSVSC